MARTLTPGYGISLTDNGSTLTVAQSGPWFNVRSATYGALGNGTNDDTAEIQAALDAAGSAGGGTVYIPAGTYITTASLQVPSNVRVIGDGAASVIKASASWPAPSGAPDTDPGYALITNDNSTASSITDHDIAIENLSFSYANLIEVSGGGTHAIRFRKAERLRVAGCTFAYGNNGTGFLACRDTLVDQCVAFEIENCGYDHWEGAARATVSNSTVIAKVGTGGAQGIQFTGTGTLNENKDSVDVIIDGNRVVGFDDSQASAIIVNAADADSSAFRFVISNNQVVDSCLGIVVEGNAGSGSIIGNHLHSGIGPQIFVKVADSDEPRDVAIIGNVIDDPQVESGDVAVMSLNGNDHLVIGNRIRKGSNTYPACCWLIGDRIHVVGNSFDTGSSVRFVVDGADCAIVDTKPNGAVRFYPRSAAPADAESGDVYYDSDDNKLKVHNGSGWQDLN